MVALLVLKPQTVTYSLTIIFFLSYLDIIIYPCPLKSWISLISFFSLALFLYIQNHDAYVNPIYVLQ